VGRSARRSVKAAGRPVTRIAMSAPAHRAPEKRPRRVPRGRDRPLHSAATVPQTRRARAARVRKTRIPRRTVAAAECPARRRAPTRAPAAATS
jgi:hypothetical protein